MKLLAKTFILLTAIVVASCSSNPRTVEDFNFDWKFKLSTDTSWREIHLPHDWSIEGEFSAHNPSTPSGGALPGGTGTYQKEFKAYPSSGKRTVLEFDGVFMNSTVYVNGHPYGPRPYGYSSFSYDITGSLQDGMNTVSVVCDNEEQPNSRWYAGCGIYRNVRLLTLDSTHVDYCGVQVTTEGEKVIAAATVVGNPSKVEFSVLDAKGHSVAQTDATVGEDGRWNAEMNVNSPQLWDIENTYLYTLRVKVFDAEGEYSDLYDQRFGFRTIAWDIDKGFFLNGKAVKLLGVCMHHDMGCIGTAFHPRALQRQLQILKEMGCNAIRTSHNPPAPQLLDMCDEMGFLVIDETMDMWRKKKTQYDYARFFDDWHEADVKDMIRRDRNHPCIIMWSMGNEILEQWNSSEDDFFSKLKAEVSTLFINFMSTIKKTDPTEKNPNILLSRHMASLIREMDTTRAITAGLNETGQFNNLIKSGALDVYGFNYHTFDYDKVRQWYPDKPMFGSETASSLNSRGWYPQPSTDIQRQPQEWWMTYDTPHHQCPAYDNMCAPWADLHEHAWMEIKKRDYMAGCFVWTGFDYLGEPTPYGWPSRSSYFGIVDLAGFPKDIYYMYQSEWTDKTVMHLFPHWNWKDGDKVDIWCYYSNADEVELFVNGKSLGRSHKEGEQLRAQWLNVPFEAGRIEAVSYLDGKEVARDCRVTAGDFHAYKLEADRNKISADGYDLSYITVTAVDADGNEIPNADTMLDFSLSGAGELFGVDNGNAADTLCLKGTKKALFAGKALAVVRSIKDQPGKATLTISDGKNSASIDISVR